MSADENKRSALGRLLARIVQTDPKETPAVVAAFLLFFCVLGGYFAVRPVRETVGTVLGKERVSDLYVVTWAVSLAIVPIYGALCARTSDQRIWCWGAPNQVSPTIVPFSCP